MQRTLREKRAGAGMVLLLTAGPLLLLTPSRPSPSGRLLWAELQGRREETASRRVRSGTAFLLLPILPAHANLPLASSEAPRGTSWALRRARRSSLLLGRWPSEGTGRNRQGGGPSEPDPAELNHIPNHTETLCSPGLFF